MSTKSAPPKNERRYGFGLADPVKNPSVYFAGKKTGGLAIPPASQKKKKERRR